LRERSVAETGARLTRNFAEHRPRLRAVAYRMLGSFADAEDALSAAACPSP
jgi:RNA polymerase sigma-70 factor (ECF subfamily)